MELKFTHFETVYKLLATRLWYSGEKVGDTLELTNVNLTIENPNFNDCIINYEDRKTSIKYLLAENIWYHAGSNEAKFIGTFAKKWLEISDDGISSNSAYGYIIKNKFNFNQLKLCLQELSLNKNSRRACIILNEANEDLSTTKDEQCTMFLQFLIRKEKLEMHAYMRSNDIIYGIIYDIPFFISLQIELANALNISIGSYYHHVTSLHCYNKDLPKLWSIISTENKEQKYIIDIERLMYYANNIYSKIAEEPENIISICKAWGILYE